MPRSSRYGQGGKLPDTVQRSCREAQELFAEAHASAVQVHGEGDRAYRIAFTVLKQKFEKRGDHWIASLAPGPSASVPCGSISGLSHYENISYHDTIKDALSASH